MQLQFPGWKEKKDYGEYCVRVCKESHETKYDVYNDIDWIDEGRVKKAENLGFGNVFYILCENKEEKRKIEEELFGKEEIAEMIDNYRKWVSVHSYIYYELGTTVVPDSVWDTKAENLAMLQEVHGADKGTWHNEDFEGFDGSTGMSLPRTEEVKEEAKELVEKNEE